MKEAHFRVQRDQLELSQINFFESSGNLFCFMSNVLVTVRFVTQSSEAGVWSGPLAAGVRWAGGPSHSIA